MTEAGRFLCPLCGARAEAEVVDSRVITSGTAIRRRRACHACRGRYTTYELAIDDPFLFDKIKSRVTALSRRLLEMAGDLERWSTHAPPGLDAPSRPPRE